MRLVPGPRQKNNALNFECLRHQKRWQRVSSLFPRWIIVKKVYLCRKSSENCWFMFHFLKIVHSFVNYGIFRELCDQMGSEVDCEKSHHRIISEGLYSCVAVWIWGLCFPYFSQFFSSILNILLAECCVTLKPETLCALGYLDLPWWKTLQDLSRSSKIL